MADSIDHRTVMKATRGIGVCPADCDDQRNGPHWHNYLDDLRAAGFVIVPNNNRLLGIRAADDGLDWETTDRDRVPVPDPCDTFSESGSSGLCGWCSRLEAEHPKKVQSGGSG